MDIATVIAVIAGVANVASYIENRIEKHRKPTGPHLKKTPFCDNICDIDIRVCRTI